MKEGWGASGWMESRMRAEDSQFRSFREAGETQSHTGTK